MPSLIALGCALFGADPAASVDWETLGPYGGYVDWMVANPTRSVAYAAQRGLFYTKNHGVTWEPLPAPPGCTPYSAGPLYVRDDGTIYVRCGQSFFRSPDDGRTWTSYTNAVQAYGVLRFDPTNLGRAILQTTDTIMFTIDDGRTWTAVPQPALVPARYLNFDPKRPGRLVGLGTDFQPIQGGALLGAAVLKESYDFGATWRTGGTVVQSDTLATDCFGLSLVVASSGTFFATTLCGTFRSSDGGITWVKVGLRTNSYPPQPDGFVPDPFREGHIYAWTATALIESVDDGVTWATLPSFPELAYPGYNNDKVAPFRDGRPLVASPAGIFRLNPADSTWSVSNVGLTGIQTQGMVVLPGQPPTLFTSGMISRDGGLSWALSDIEGQPIRWMHPNATVFSSVLATTYAGARYRSLDTGQTWVVVAPPLANRDNYNDVIEFMIPVGPQPGLVYGLSGFCRDSGFTGCFPTPRDVVRSVDGGKTWTSTLTTGVGGGPIADQLAVSPADPNTLLVGVGTAIYQSRDGALTWQKIGTDMPSGAFSLVAHPTEAARWYALMAEGPLLVSSDFGTTWTNVETPTLPGGFMQLLIDRVRPSRLYLLGADGSISASEDLGGRWQSVASAPPAGFRLTAVQLAPLAGNLLYASSDRGNLKMTLGVPAYPAGERLVEYYRADVDHYFVSADPVEIAKLDALAATGGPFERTGESFKVWPTFASDDDAASVCRFYGRPEAQLDSHFFSASPMECAEVTKRFSASWLLESARVFAVNLPSAFGLCRPGTAPVYRLFNNRSDANHRYTTSLAIRDEMVGRGWIAEGYGPANVVMCSPL